ncbi:hypothetical protein [Chromobacterium haemolyticum]|uniref:hypothetical protein n=1 Tax=Chromobacterium haemolyticum TaxID=394935 RepID=UPI001319522B|nr:hypothetical protein [Chromobacterium haemolyticum]BBH12934.1 hypothetical protein CH06BL_21820 [Chromobacterium haemolyticum]
MHNEIYEKLKEQKCLKIDNLVEDGYSEEAIKQILSKPDVGKTSGGHRIDTNKTTLGTLFLKDPETGAAIHSEQDWGS